MSKNWVYDIETIVNCFTLCAVNVETKEEKRFVIHESRNDGPELADWLNEIHISRGGLIGFNNRAFDWPVLFNIYQTLRQPADIIIKKAYSVAQQLISQEKRDYVDEWIPQLDLYLINHYNNKNRATSLKAVQVAIKWHNVMDNLYPHYEPVSKAQLEALLKYNMNDVLSTLAFFEKNSDKIELRRKLGKKFTRLRKRFMNASDVSVGEMIFLHKLCENMGVTPKEIKEMKKRGGNVPLNKIIFPSASFTTPEFIKVYDRMMNTVVGADEIEDTLRKVEQAKGASTEDLLEIISEKGLQVKRKPQSKKKKGFDVVTRWGDFRFFYGIGGIHGCIHPGLYKAEKGYVIRDADVKSYYPNLAIRNRLHPYHLPQDVFCATYEGIFDDRVAAQKEGDKVMSDGLKLSLNGIFGKSGFRESHFYDPYFFCGITINGQLLLSMLAERILTAGIDCQILQINTDGVTFKVKEEDLPIYDQVCKKWEEDTGMWLEFVDYEFMAIRDVNNYIAKSTAGKVKLKGQYEIEKEWHKDNSFAVIPLAVKNYFCDNIPVVETLSTHPDLYDFCGRYKGTANWSVEFVYLGEKNGIPSECRDIYGKIFRYIPVKKGGTSIKVNKKDGRVINLLAGRQTEAFSVYHEIDRNNIDLDYFIWQTETMINDIIRPQTDLFR